MPKIYYISSAFKADTTLFLIDKFCKAISDCQQV